MNAPMTPERLAEIRSSVEHAPEWSAFLSEIDRRDLLAEVDRLRAQVREARGWVLNAVDPVAVGRDVKQRMLDKLALASGDGCPTCHQLDPCPTHDREQWAAENPRTASGDQVQPCGNCDCQFGCEGVEVQP